MFIWRDTAVRTYFGTAITVFNNYLLPYPHDPLYLSHKNCHVKFARVKLKQIRRAHRNDMRSNIREFEQANEAVVYQARCSGVSSSGVSSSGVSAGGGGGYWVNIRMHETGEPRTVLVSLFIIEYLPR